MRARAWIVAAAVAVFLIALVRLRGPSNRSGPTPPRVPAKRGVPTSVTRPPRTPTPSGTPESEVQRHNIFVVAWQAEATATPTPAPTAGEPTPRLSPSPTPDVSQCVTAESSASMLAAAPGQVLVDIRATNHCGRDLAPLDVWFWVAGYRQGELVQSVRGHPFELIPRDGDAEVHIGLPGSIDWYDRIEVRVISPDSP
jgi:hypothetical protein